jgi:GntR family transcriptional regulator
MTSSQPSPPTTINREEALPYYAQLGQILRREIAEGRFKPGQALPSEAELGSLYGISRTAVRQALAELVAEGLVQKEKGKGSFVRRSPLAEFTVQELRGFFDEMTDKGHKVSDRVLAQEIVASPPEVAGELRIPMGTKAVRLFRIREVDGVSICETETYLPAGRFEALAEIDLGGKSLYSILRSKFGIVPKGGQRLIESVAAEESTARNLGIELGVPLLKLTAVNFDQSEVPFERFTALYRGDSSRFELAVRSKA